MFFYWMKCPRHTCDACMGVHVCLLAWVCVSMPCVQAWSINSHVLCFTINVRVLKWYVDLWWRSPVSMFKPLWEPHRSLQTRGFHWTTKESKDLVMETFWKPMKHLIHSCVQREAVKRSVSLPHHAVSHTLHEQNTIWSLKK